MLELILTVDQQVGFSQSCFVENVIYVLLKSFSFNPVQFLRTSEQNLNKMQFDSKIFDYEKPETF